MTSGCPESNLTFPIYLKEPLGVAIARIGVQIVIGLFGITGNAMVCLTIIRKPRVLGPTTQYILSLSIADLGVLLFNFPIAILKQQDPFKWLLGEVFCLYIAPATETFFAAAIFSITLISFERYVNVTRTKLHVRSMRSRNRRRLLLVAVWTTSFILISVPLYMFQAYDSCHKVCYLTWSRQLFWFYMIALNVLLYILPLLIITFSSLRIARLVSRRTKLILREESSLSTTTSASHKIFHQSSSLKTMLRQKRKTYRILQPLVILFAVTMFPFTAFRMALTFWTDLPHKNYYPSVFTLVVISTVINSAADPLVYCVVNREFRQEIKCVLPGNIFGKVRAVLRKRKKGGYSRGNSGLRPSLMKDTSL